MSNEESEYPNILLIHLRRIGDVMMTTPSIRALRQQFPHAQIDFITTFYNFCMENKRLRQKINPKAQRFETKFKKISPAMAEGLVQKIYSLEELLMFRRSS